MIIYSGKDYWPELVGVSGDLAVSTIERENPGVNAFILRTGIIPVTDFRCDRVWVHVDDDGYNVTQAPMIG